MRGPRTTKVEYGVRMTSTPSAAAAHASRPQRESELRTTGVPLVQVHQLEKTYKTARGPLTLFRDLDLEVASGELVAIVGQSGAGKSTLLHILGALDTPSAGTIYCASTNVATLSSRQAAAFRNREIGYVWQFHYLLPEFTAQENVAMPLLARGMAKREALELAANWLREVGLDERRDHRPGELSGGEQQRVALARALAPRPQLLFADEPTGNLDSANGAAIADLLFKLNAERGATLFLVTHEDSLAARCQRVVRLQSGRIVADA